MTHVDAFAAGVAAAPPAATSTGTIIGAAIGGALLVVVVLAVAIRAKIVSAQLNGPTVSAWNPGQKKKKVRVPDFDIALNPRQQPTTNPAFSVRSLRVTSIPV